MNQEAVRVSADSVFDRREIPFGQIPHQSALFLDFLNDAGAVREFYPNGEVAAEDYIAEVLNNYQVDRQKLCGALENSNQSLGAGEKTRRNIELLRQRDCVTVVTGQQAGLFSGAIYTIYKAISAIKYAAELRRKNINAVPVFWVAEEDHDFDEIKKTSVVDRNGELCDLENTPRSLIKNAPVGLIELDATIAETLDELFESLPATEFTANWRTILTQTYQPNESFSRTFAKFLTVLFADYGLIVVLPLDEQLKKLCAPIFAEAVENSEAIVAALLRRNGELEKGNYQPQVLVEKDSFPFFYQNENGVRQALRRSKDGEKIKVLQSKNEFSRAELAGIARQNPERLSPNALLRPVVQDYLLPTARYYGGAAEIAYFAQNSAIYQTLNRPVTPIRHRASFTIIEPKQARTLSKYDLRFQDLFARRQTIEAAIVERFLNDETAQVFASVEKNVTAQLHLLGDNLIKREPALAVNLANRQKKILWHLDALRQKYHRAEMLKNRVLERRLANLFTALLPHDALQERTFNALVFLNQYGANFIEWLYDAADANEQAHTILTL